MKNSFLYIKDYYDALKTMYVDGVDLYEWFTIVKSNVIDDGIWNFVCDFKTKKYETFKLFFQKSKVLFKNRIPRFYILKSDLLAKYLDKMKEDFAIYCKDTWFITDLEQLDFKYKSILDLEIKLCANKNDIINTIMKGFSTGDVNDPYGDLSPTYRHSLEQKILKENIDTDVFHYVAYYNNKPISILSVTKPKKGNIAYLNNLTTLQLYKGKGVAKEILAYIIKELKKNKVEKIMFATETGAYTEKFYINLGFQIYEYGYCFEEKSVI